MSERIPHLTGLRAFEAAARHASFQKAADELGLTPSAISHQIRQLEAYLDLKLFNRLTRAVELTVEGRALAQKLEAGFRLIEGAVREVRTLKSPSVIVVTAGPAIAAKWLIPRLYLFQEQYPSIEVRVSTSNKVVDLTRDDIDVALRHGRGDYAGLASVRLFGEAYAPMCAPHLLADPKRPLKKPSDLAHHRLLHDESAALPGATAGWTEWLAAAHVKGVDAKSSIKYPQADHAIQAAMDGTGVLFGRIAIAAFDLAAKRLVMPFDTVLPSPFGYYLVTRQGRTRERAVAAFLAWMQAQAVDLPPVVR